MREEEVARFRASGSAVLRVDWAREEDGRSAAREERLSVRSCPLPLAEPVDLCLESETTRR